MKFATFTNYEVRDRVQIISMARTDAIGTVIEIRNGEFYIVRLPNWQADGYHLDVACRNHELKAAVPEATDNDGVPESEHEFDESDLALGQE